MTESRVVSVLIIICSDEFKYGGLGLTPTHVPVLVNEFDFQCVEEPLRDGVIAAGSVAPHAAARPLFLINC